MRFLTLNNILRSLQLLLTLVVLGTNAYLTSWYRAHTRITVSPPSSLFLVALSAVTLVLLPYLYLNPITPPASSSTSARRVTPRYAKLIILVLDTVLTCAWLGGFAAQVHFRSQLHLCFAHICDLMIASAAAAGLAIVVFGVCCGVAAKGVASGRREGGNVEMEARQHENWAGVKVQTEVVVGKA